MKRFSYCVAASLQLFSDDQNAPQRVLHTRKVNPRGAAFVSPSQVPVGHAGIARLPSPHGGFVEAHCTIARCRLVAPNRYEGAICFSREQNAFSEDTLSAASSITVPQLLAA